MSYDRDLVQRLLPSVWDPLFVFGGLEDPTAPDPDMPRNKANPKAANTLYAMLADIKRAWHRAPLELAERRALFLHAALGLKKSEAGRWLGFTRDVTLNRIDSGVGKLVDYLTGYEPEPVTTLVQKEGTTE